MTLKSYDLNNHDFIEEIPDELLKPMKFANKKKSKKRLIFIIILLFLSLTCLASYYFYNKDVNDKNIKMGELYIIHSNIYFGNTITNFTNYTSLKNANSYKFYIENNNNFSINYKVKLYNQIDKNIDSNVVNLNKISYKIIKNNKELKTSKLKNNNINSILSTNIKANSVDNYEILIWCNKPINGYYKYKVVIEG